MTVTVLGCGRWGSFLAWYLDKTGHSVTLWGREGSENLKLLKNTGKNEYVTLPKSVKLTDSMDDALRGADCAIISISGQHLRSLAQKLSDFSRPVVLCMKGIEATTGKRLSQTAAEFLPEQNIAVWVGPGHIQCFVRGIPNCMLIDGVNRRLTSLLIDNFNSSLIKFYQGDDLIGSELGAAAKNVIGIAAGMLDGFNLTTLKGALMARGAREVARLIAAMGGNQLSAYGLCHLGDYETTLFSPYSQNRAFGEAFVTGKPFSKLAEGVKTADGMMLLAEKHGVELPITAAVQKIIRRGCDPKEALTELFARTNRREF